MSSAIFPRAEIAAAEVLTFEISSERGIYSDGDLSSAGACAMASAGAALAGASLSSAGAALLSVVGAALAQADVTAIGIAAAAFPGSSLVQGSLASAGTAGAALEGVTFMPIMPLGDDPMNKGAEQRAMARPGEGRAMQTTVADGIERPAEQRGMTK